MRRNRPNRGLGIAVSLMVLAIISVITLAVASMCVAGLNFANGDRRDVIARYGAEAGVAEAAYNLYSAPDWREGFSNKALRNNAEVTYTVRVYNNYSGNGNITASVDGTVIPAGSVYVHSAGTFNGVTRNVGALYQITQQSVFQYTAFGRTSLTFTGGSTTDSYNSSKGTYAETRQDTDGDVGTNSTGNRAVTLSGSTTHVHGTISIGPGGNASNVVNASSSQYESAVVMTNPQALPSTNIPTVGSEQGDRSGGNMTLAPGQSYGEIRVTGGGTLTLQAGTYVVDTLTLAGNSRLILPASGNVIVYVRGDSHGNGVDLSGGTVVNPSLEAPRLVFYASDAVTRSSVSGGAEASYALYAPRADIAITGGSDLYGAVVGNTVTNTGGTALHYDIALREGAANQPKMSRKQWKTW